MQRCAVERCSKLGPFVLTTSDELAAAQLSIRFRAKCRGHHLCDKHRAQIPGRHREAGAIALAAAAEAREAKASAEAAILHDQLTYDRGVRDGYFMRTEAERMESARKEQSFVNENKLIYTPPTAPPGPAPLGPPSVSAVGTSEPIAAFTGPEVVVAAAFHAGTAWTTQATFSALLNQPMCTTKEQFLFAASSTEGAAVGADVFPSPVADASCPLPAIPARTSKFKIIA